VHEQLDMFADPSTEPKRVAIGRAEAKTTLLDRLENFLAHHTSGDDLGLRLRGEQLATGVRFVRLLREGTYDLVVANPPYQGTGKMAETAYVSRTYPLGKANLYAAFLLRGLDLVRVGGVSAMLTLRNWMFIRQYSDLREYILWNFDVRGIGDFAVGAFDEVANDVLSVSVSVLHRSPHRPELSVAHQPTPPEDTSYDRARTQRKRSATLCHEGRHDFDPAALKGVPEWPLVYWWSNDFLEAYLVAPKLKDVGQVRLGMSTSNNTRYVRCPWEVKTALTPRWDEPLAPNLPTGWVPTVMGAKSLAWFEPLRTVVQWAQFGLEMKVDQEVKYGSSSRRIQSQDKYFVPGIAFTMLGERFRARMHRYRSIFGDKGSSVFPEALDEAVCAMNRTLAASFIEDLTSTLSFTVGDVAQLPIASVGNSRSILEVIDGAFSLHEYHREPSVDFRRPGPSPWRYAQDWAQAAVDRPESAPLPEYTERLEPEPATDHLSFALGVALGRFGAAGGAAEGILDRATADLSRALPHGILFLDITLDAEDRRDSLGHPATVPLHAAWAKYGPAVGTKRSLRDWLALDFFKDVHKGMYENRPILWPLSSPNKTFVAWVNIHRMNGQTLQVLLADHLTPTLTRLDGELADLRAVRDGADKTAARDAERQYDRVFKARSELQEFMADVEQCADRGAPPTDGKCPPREQDARYAPDVDDGVMINSAALWPLLNPQWKDPKKWWKELATASGRKDYDWSHLAMRYWPGRVDGKSRQNPSLGVAHGCFWRYHPERAWTWELRLQDAIGPDFRIEEPPYRPGGRDLGDVGDVPHRDAFLRDHPKAAIAAIEREATRRMGRGKRRKVVPEVRILETGLWTGHAEDLWDLELDLAERQGAEIRILAPDEPVARTAFEAAHPDKVADRKDFLASLVPPVELFDDEDADQDEDESGEDDA
jgi:hypothetical protein